MTQLLKLEWMKVRRYRAFWVLGILFAVGVVGINYIVWINTQLLNAVAGDVAEGVDLSTMILGRPYAFPGVWHTVAYVSSYMLFLPGLLVILLTANEYGFRTHRQAVITGMSRMQFFMGKVWFVAALAVAATVVVAVTALLFGLSGPTGFSFKGMEYLGYYFIQALSYMSAALLTVVLLKRSGLSIGIFFLYAFIIENVLALMLNFNVHDTAGNFLPLNSAEALIPFPGNLGNMFGLERPEVWHLAVAAVAWIFIMLWAANTRFRRSDL